VPIDNPAGEAMTEGRRPTFDVADYEVLAETPELRMVVLTIGEASIGTPMSAPLLLHAGVNGRGDSRTTRSFRTHPGDTCVVPARRAMM
jgi:hypothetical protein